MPNYSYEKKFDVVIIGAGVIGCAIAYFLARQSEGKIKIGVIEKGGIGGESSGGAAGMVAAQTETKYAGPFFDLALESRKSFNQLSQELEEFCGVDIGYLQSGILSIAFNATEEKALREKMEWQKGFGLECQWFSSDQLLQKFPFLKTKSFGGFWAPQDGQLSSSRLVKAFAEGAKKMGVSFFENESFSPLPFKEPQLDSIETKASRFVAEKFIFAAGCWTGKLLGERIHLKPIKGQILIFDIPAKWNVSHWQTPLFCGSTPEPESIHCYFVPKLEGHIFLGATSEDCGFDKSENKNLTAKLFQYGCEIFPELASFPFRGTWVGLRPATMDGLPVFGLVPGFKNLYVASGHFRNGILLAPITGKILSELILQGRSSFPIQPFSPERFFQDSYKQ